MIKNYLDLCRVSNLPTIWTNVLTAALLSGVSFSWVDFLGLSVSLSLFYTGGMCLNDIFDREADRIAKPFRPIPSGRITVRDAGIFTAVLFIAALVLLLPAPHGGPAFLLGLILLGLIYAYDRSHKKNPLSVLLMAACRLMVFFITAVAVSGGLGKLVLVAGLVQFLYILALSVGARFEGRLKTPPPFPLIPALLAGISLVDGLLMAVLVKPVWFWAGALGFGLTGMGQRFVRGD